MVICDFEVPKLKPSYETSTSAIIRIECILKTFDVKGETFFIGEYSHSVSYSEFFTKTFYRFYLVIGSISKLMFIDIVVGLTRDKQKYIILIARTKCIFYRRIKSINKDRNRHIAHLIHLAKEGVIKRNSRFLEDKRHHHFSVIVHTLIEVLFHFLIAPKCPIEDEVEVIMEAVFQNLIRDSHRCFLEITRIIPIVSTKHLSIGVDIDDDEIRLEI